MCVCVCVCVCDVGLSLFVCVLCAVKQDKKLQKEREIKKEAERIVWNILALISREKEIKSSLTHRPANSPSLPPLPLPLSSLSLSHSHSQCIILYGRCYYNTYTMYSCILYSMYILLLCVCVCVCVFRRGKKR